MEKRCLILICLCLCGCNKKSAACVRYSGENEVGITLNGLNDKITSIEVNEVFVLPYELLLNEEEFKRFSRQLDVSYHFEENRLIRNYAIAVDGDYSFVKTIKALEKEKYHCE